MLASGGGAEAQVAMALGFRADDRRLNVELAERALDVANIGNGMCVGKLLVPLMDPVGDTGVVGHDRQLEPWMRCDAARHVVVLCHAQDGTTEDGGSGHV